MSVVYDRLPLSTTKEKENKMTVENKTYQVGDLFTTQRSGVTGTIKEIVNVKPNQNRVKLEVDGKDRWTTVTIK
jgi:hypothetical protein